MTDPIAPLAAATSVNSWMARGAAWMVFILIFGRKLVGFCATIAAVILLRGY